MDFGANHYFDAALERISQAQFLYKEGKGHFALSMYSAGLAVECMLRAYVVRRKREFESRHDLTLLFTESGILEAGEKKLRKKGLSEEAIQNHQRELLSSINDVSFLWRNTFRFASESRLLTYLKKSKLYKGVKGDILKAKAYELLKAAQRFVEKGAFQWE